jgi:hypothetical protein
MKSDDNPVRRFNGVQNVHAKAVKRCLQRPSPAHQVCDGHLGPVHHHRVGVYLAEGRLGIIPRTDRLRPQRNQTFQQSHHSTSLLYH